MLLDDLVEEGIEQWIRIHGRSRRAKTPQLRDSGLRLTVWLLLSLEMSAEATWVQELNDEASNNM
jgi:hypothetical protein